MRVLVVDDSLVFRSQITATLKEVAGVEVAGTASNGKIALQMLEAYSVDLVTLDMEMPELNGLETLIEIRKKKFPVKVIVFSSQTTKGAEKALEALTAGADDIVAKPGGEISNFNSAQDAIRTILIPKVLQFIDPKLKKLESKIVENKTEPPKKEEPLFKDYGAPRQSTIAKKRISMFRPQVVVIASSTGGPPALEQALKQIGSKLKYPILIAQHMPPVFTEILAKRLSATSGITVYEAKDKQEVLPGCAYLAPGDFHMELKKIDQKLYISLNQKPQRNSVRPAADYLFESASEVFGGGCLGIVLTGMGEDGAVGAQRIRQNNGAIIIQEKSSCVVFGMPGAIFDRNDYDEIQSLDQIRNTIIELGA